MLQSNNRIQNLVSSIVAAIIYSGKSLTKSPFYFWLILQWLRFPLQCEITQQIQACVSIQALIDILVKSADPLTSYNIFMRNILYWYQKLNIFTSLELCSFLLFFVSPSKRNLILKFKFCKFFVQKFVVIS